MDWDDLEEEAKRGGPPHTPALAPMWCYKKHVPKLLYAYYALIFNRVFIIYEGTSS